MDRSKPPRIQTIPPNSPSAPDKVRKELDRVLASPDFQATRLQREFLRFVVSETLAGRAETIKGYTIATQVFGRKQDFDAKLDPIVSIQASALRRALERYYLLEGKDDSVVIDIPKGTYVPAFRTQTQHGSGGAEAAADNTAGRPKPSSPVLIVRPFANLTENQDMNYLAVGIAMELAQEITRHQEIQVLLMPPQSGPGSRASDGEATFALDGSIMVDREEIKVNVHLVDLRNDRQIWGDAHKSRFDPARLIAFQEHVATVVAAHVAGEGGVISQKLSGESRNVPPAELTTYEAILRFHEYERTFAPALFERALTALTHAYEIEPDNGQIQSMLARLYCNAYSLEVPGFEAVLGKALALAESAVVQLPDSQRAHGVLAFVRMIMGDIEQARLEVDRAIELNPNSYFMLGGFAWLMTLVGEWERGVALIRRVIRVNPYHTFLVHHALWLDWFRRGEFLQAHRETLNFRRPALFWEPLMKAATLGHLGKIDDGARNIAELLELKPDFPKRARILVGHYVKFDDILESVLAGLQKSGLKIR
jgi:adenylate cyclase